MFEDIVRAIIMQQAEHRLIERERNSRSCPRFRRASNGMKGDEDAVTFLVLPPKPSNYHLVLSIGGNLTEVRLLGRQLGCSKLACTCRCGACESVNVCSFAMPYTFRPAKGTHAVSLAGAGGARQANAQQEPAGSHGRAAPHTLPCSRFLVTSSK